MIGGTAPTIETIPGQQGRYIPSRATYGDNRSAGGGYAAPTPTTYRVNGQTFATLREAQAYADKLTRVINTTLRLQRTLQA